MGLWNVLALCGRESMGRKFRHLCPAEDGQKWSDHLFRNWNWYGYPSRCSCIGQSEFSESVDTNSAVIMSVGLDIPSVLLLQTELKVKSVTSETTELEWITPPDGPLYFGLWFLVDSCRLERTRFIWWYNHQEFFYGETLEFCTASNPRRRIALQSEPLSLTDRKRVRPVNLLNYLPLPKRSILKNHLLRKTRKVKVKWTVLNSNCA